ncbi:adenylate/guanylate cyclase domain-containing protein [Variovorax sp.]|uniref:CHASE2 domain-containing protein n=1 Tax=Variovorax sp. TaxID=1871043 RepID=UPI002D3E785C|nr:adenylate/guanylate cyclase domain-containing protein [Variovorax sp.]HYP82877.1 adenylate/guanylate cyclase domain-containing protein [Variovorax sp.]
MAARLRLWPRILVTLLPVALMLLQAISGAHRSMVESLDYSIYDWRLRATLAQRSDPRIVIVDVDDASLQRVGQWPWSRDKLAQLTHELMERQQAAVLGFDMVFPEQDRSSGLASLRALANGPLHDNASLQTAVQRLALVLDHDGNFAQAMQGHKVVLGYYLTQGPQPLARGVLPPPLLSPSDFPAGHPYATHWNGYGGNIAPLARAATTAGFINAAIVARSDGLLRSTPLLAYYEGNAGVPGYYESLGLAVYRLAAGVTAVTPEFAANGEGQPPTLKALALAGTASTLNLPVTSRGRMLIPFLGASGPAGGTFTYIPAHKLLEGALAPGALKGKIVLVGTTAPGLQDLRPTPVSATFPGVEVHASIVSALLDRRVFAVPDYAPGYEVAVLAVTGLVLAIGLTLLPLARATLLLAAMLAAVVGLNTWLFVAYGLVLPLASALVMMALTFAVNVSWGYLVESRVRRGLANLFGTYVPPQLVEKMLEQPDQYSMRAESKELTVMFCDMRGFTQLSEQLAPVVLQGLLNDHFSRLTEIISRHGGTVDKYIGDCVMAFWGAPVDNPDHAALAVRAAIEMTEAVKNFGTVGTNPEVRVGIGINTGVMRVGDMGSTVRRSYTVVGDAVNLASRLEGLSSTYGVTVVASDATMRRAGEFAWQELDRVKVRGRQQAVTIFTPIAAREALTVEQRDELQAWDEVLAAYHAGEIGKAQALLVSLLRKGEQKVLYQVYAERLASMELRPFDPERDRATRFESK